MYWSLDHSVPGMSKKSNLINKIICCVQEGYSIHRKIFSPNCVKKVKKNPTKFKITNFSLEPLYDWIWSKYHQFTCFHTFLCIYDGYLRKKLKIFHFHFFLLFVIFWDFGNMSHMITRYEKTADFLAQMAFGSSTRSYWFPKLKKIWSDNSKIV